MHLIRQECPPPQLRFHSPNSFAARLPHNYSSGHSFPTSLLPFQTRTTMNLASDPFRSKLCCRNSHIEIPTSWAKIGHLHKQEYTCPSLLNTEIRPAALAYFMSIESCNVITLWISRQHNLYSRKHHFTVCPFTLTQH